MKDEAGTLAYQEIGELVASLKSHSGKYLKKGNP
jgi:hypothetical protein